MKKFIRLCCVFQEWCTQNEKWSFAKNIVQWWKKQWTWFSANLGKIPEKTWKNCEQFVMILTIINKEILAFLKIFNKFAFFFLLFLTAGDAVILWKKMCDEMKPQGEKEKSWRKNYNRNKKIRKIERNFSAFFPLKIIIHRLGKKNQIFACSHFSI